MGARHESVSEPARSRLINEMNRYLEALDARDVRRLRLAPNLRCTENTRTLPPGSGLWRTIRGRRSPGHYFVDEVGGQVEYWSTIDEMGAAAIYGVRLRIEGRLISEIETLVLRGAGRYFAPDAVVASPVEFHEVIPPEERVPREQLIRVANLYFDAIELDDASRLPVADSCRRLVNGILDSKMDPSEVAKLDKSEAHRALGVAEQITGGHYAYIEALRARRYPIVDEARGIVLAHVMFDHPGDLKRADGEVPMRSPNSMLAYEVFKVRKGVLSEVWAIGGALPYGIDSGWPT